MSSFSKSTPPRKFLLDRIDYERMRVMPYGLAEFRLSRMRQLLARLGNPHIDLPASMLPRHQGKGSTAAALAAVLTAAPGLFTSPHLERVEERIAIDGRAGSPGNNCWPTSGPWSNSMDREAAAAGGADRAHLFRDPHRLPALCRTKIDLAVLEVGLGSTPPTSARPMVSVITSISLTRQLGTLAAIAAEKAGIAELAACRW